MATVDYAKYRASPLESARISDLIRILPRGRSSILEIGARDGYISRVLADYFENVTALDLEQPSLEIEGVTPVRGDVSRLEFPDRAFDVVCCLEVLEHLAPLLLERACREIVRVARHEVVIGVPYRQDLRISRTTCRSCGGINPPWGHRNSFDDDRLVHLFRPLELLSKTYVGVKKIVTNPVSVFLMDLGRNPWGTYNQEERCLHCGSALVSPDGRPLWRRMCSAAADGLNRAQSAIAAPSPVWVHAVFQKV